MASPSLGGRIPTTGISSGNPHTSTYSRFAPSAKKHSSSARTPAVATSSGGKGTPAVARAATRERTRTKTAGRGAAKAVTAPIQSLTTATFTPVPAPVILAPAGAAPVIPAPAGAAPAISAPDGAAPAISAPATSVPIPTTSSKRTPTVTKPKPTISTDIPVPVSASVSGPKKTTNTQNTIQRPIVASHAVPQPKQEDYPDITSDLTRDQTFNNFHRLKTKILHVSKYENENFNIKLRIIQNNKTPNDKKVSLFVNDIFQNINFFAEKETNVIFEKLSKPN